MNICVKCAEEKSNDDFYFNQTSQHRDKTCKKCRCSVANQKASDLTYEERRELNLIKRYGITIEEYTSILEAQGGGCAICDRTDTLCVDHCHTSGIVRGILCRRCNTHLEYINELEGAKRMLNFLQPHEEVTLCLN